VRTREVICDEKVHAVRWVRGTFATAVSP
jgi:hypothetical protein